MNHTPTEIWNLINPQRKHFYPLKKKKKKKKKNRLPVDTKTIKDSGIIVKKYFGR